MDTAIGWVISKLLDYKYVAMFGILFMCGMGLPIPEEVTLVGTGLLVGWGDARFIPASISCVLGILAGDSIIFGLGYHYGPRFLRSRPMRFLLPPKRQLKVARFFGKHGTKAVFFARFFAGVRIGVYSYAGSQRMSWIKFLILDLLGALISGPTSVAIGWWCAHTIADNRQEAQDLALHIVRKFGHWLVLGILVLLAVIVVAQLVRKNRPSGEKEEPPRRDPPEVRVPRGPEEAEALEARVGAVPGPSGERPGGASLE